MISGGSNVYSSFIQVYSVASESVSLYCMAFNSLVLIVDGSVIKIFKKGIQLDSTGKVLKVHSGS